jgi:DNA-directed RNA polymerase specialized sigma24 family protein
MADMPELPGTVDGVDHLPFDPVWEAVRDLPVRQRVALIQRVVLDRSYADVALEMGGSEETARANVYQALKKLRREVTRS